MRSRVTITNLEELFNNPTNTGPTVHGERRIPPSNWEEFVNRRGGAGPYAVRSAAIRSKAIVWASTCSSVVAGDISAIM